LPLSADFGNANVFDMGLSCAREVLNGRSRRADAPKRTCSHGIPLTATPPTIGFLINGNFYVVAAALRTKINLSKIKALATPVALVNLWVTVDRIANGLSYG
jgi:hypothetical protein